jgi:glucan 1,3-beta-glucosidase
MKGLSGSLNGTASCRVLIDCKCHRNTKYKLTNSVLDQHPYLAFGTPNKDPWAAQAGKACNWGGGTNDTQKSFGVVIGGEWSLATNNCGKWLNGVDSTPSYETSGQGSCKEHEEWFNWDQEYKDGLNSYCQANMDALQNWFFWTWKIGNSTELGYAPSPFWHYQLGLKEGWIPADPRTAGGYCGRALSIGGAQVSIVLCTWIRG